MIPSQKQQFHCRLRLAVRRVLSAARLRDLVDFELENSVLYAAE